MRIRRTADVELPPPPPADEKFEIEQGVWDPVFTAVSAGAAFILIVIEIWVGCSLASMLKVGTVELTLADDVTANGDFAQRFVATLAVAGLTLGGIILTIGAWLAALELRSRLSIRMPASTVIGRRTLGVDDAKGIIEVIGGLAEKLGKIRGTSAVIVAGIAVVIAALAAGASVVVSVGNEDGGTGTSQEDGEGTDGDTPTTGEGDEPAVP